MPFGGGMFPSILLTFMAIYAVKMKERFHLLCNLTGGHCLLPRVY